MRDMRDLAGEHGDTEIMCPACRVRRFDPTRPSDPWEPWTATTVGDHDVGEDARAHHGVTRIRHLGRGEEPSLRSPQAPRPLAPPLGLRYGRRDTAPTRMTWLSARGKRCPRRWRSLRSSSMVQPDISKWSATRDRLREEYGVCMFTTSHVARTETTSRFDCQWA